MIKKILVPLDCSKSDDKLLHYAETLAEKFEAELLLVWVVQPMPVLSGYGEGVSYVPSFIQEQPETNPFNLYLSGVKNELRQRHSLVNTVVVEGYSEAEAIVNLARRESIDLIVMSIHRRSGISRWIHHGMADKVLQDAPCPVLLARTTEAED
jgi:nucleotide-binding universal stress UspA family protein